MKPYTALPWHTSRFILTCFKIYIFLNFQFRFASAVDRVMLCIAFLSAFITGCVAPLNTLVFADLTEAMIYYAVSQIPGGSTEGMKPVELSDAVLTFTLRSIGLGVTLLVFSYLATMLSNYAAHNQVKCCNLLKKSFLIALYTPIEL